MMTQDVLRLENVTKSFGNVEALKEVSLSVGGGQVVALLGDNGAGKSTLIKAVSGLHQFDGGRIFIGGKEVAIRRPRDAMDLGIETIHQDSSLAADLSIARNLFLGREPVHADFLGVLAPLDLGQLRQQASNLLRRVGITKNLDADAPISALSGGERQAIAISRAMHFFARIIILDEPTNNLGVEETQGVLRFITEVRDAGHTVIYITHNIHHVFQVADRIVIMRQGSIVADLDAQETDILGVEAIITDAEIGEIEAEARLT